MGARGAAGAQSPARGVRAPRTMAPGRGGDAGTGALAALVRRLAQSRRRSRYLPAQPRRARPAAAPAAAPGGSRGEHSGRPRSHS